jgi:hypothetical protein
MFSVSFAFLELQVGEKRGGIDEACSSGVRWGKRIEGAEMSRNEDMGMGEVDGGRRRRRLTKCFLFFSFSFSFAKSLLYTEETKAEKYVKLDGDGWGKEGNDPAWWPLSEQGSWTK